MIETTLPPNSRVLLFANTDWYLCNFRLALALALRDQGCEVMMVAPPGPYASRFSAYGLRYVPFTFERLSLNPAQQASAVCRLAALYRRERPNLVHHFTIKCAVYGSLAARLVGPVAIVNALTGLGSVFAQQTGRFRYTRQLVLQTLKIALSGTQIVVQNPEDRALLIQNGLAAPSKTALIRGSGVDLDRFKSSERPDHGRLRVLLASRLIRSKGIHSFESVAARLGHRQGSEFLVAGAPDTGNPDTLEPHELDAISRRGHVRLLGHVDDMAALLSTVDVIVLPTTYGEGVPRILIEAAAAGLPLIATDVAGCREIVRPEVNGILVPPIDVDALGDAVERLLNNADLRQAMGRMSRVIASEFSEERVINETIAVYARALGWRQAASLPDVSIVTQ